MKREIPEGDADLEDLGTNETLRGPVTYTVDWAKSTTVERMHGLLKHVNYQLARERVLFEAKEAAYLERIEALQGPPKPISPHRAQLLRVVRGRSR